MNNQSEAFKSSPKNDYREYLRKNCYLPIIEPEQNTEPFGNVLNLSTSGLFMVTKEGKDLAGQLKARFFVPNISDPINFLGKVVYVKNEGDGQFLGMGVRFVELEAGYKKALRSYVLNHGFTETLGGFQKKSESSIQNLKPFHGADVISPIFYAASQQQAPVQIFWCRRYVLIETHLQEVGKYHLSLKFSQISNQSVINQYDHLYLGMTYRGASYFFEATVKYVRKDSLTITKPEVIYFEERRVESRYAARPVGDVENATVEMRWGESREQSVQQVVEFNSSGLSFHRPLGDDFFSPGQIIQEINLIKGREIQKQQSAKIVHVTAITDGKVKVGLKFHVERQPYEFKEADRGNGGHEKRSMPSQLFKTANNFLETCGNIFRQHLSLHPRVQLARYYNNKGEELVAIINATFDLDQRDRKVIAPVIIIPPAFARRKETTGLLAMIIVETFRKNNKEVVVMRFDGIRCIGESYNDKDCVQVGKEMVRYTLSQLVEDIGTTIGYARKNSMFLPSNMAIITFSMASVAARKAILRDREKDIDCWISCMGASDPDDLMKNSTGGIDYLLQFRQGEKLAIKQVLGHMVDLDGYCRDIESNHMAYLKDARREMAQIAIPVTWIYGKYDYWINKNRILDIMSVKSKGLRKVYEVPWGHIVKTSDEAVEVFKLITRCVWKELGHSDDVVPSVPSTARRSEFERIEWSRIRKKEIDYKNYWRTYLLGQEKEELGFDLITLTDEYDELMQKQLELLEIKDADLIMDMGGGTGNFIQCYLENAPMQKQSFHSSRGPRIIMVDFVKEALLKASDKHKKLISAAGLSSSNFSYITADLEAVKGPLRLPFKDHRIDKILASLFISYVKTPDITLKEGFRVLRPGGMIVMSSVKPDTDMSKPIHALIEKIKTKDTFPYFKDKNREELLTAVQHYINSAAYLTDLEEEKLFKFYNAEELKQLLFDSGFRNIRLHETFGHPAQGVIAVGFKL